MVPMLAGLAESPVPAGISRRQLIAVVVPAYYVGQWASMLKHRRPGPPRVIIGMLLMSLSRRP